MIERAGASPAFRKITIVVGVKYGELEIFAGSYERINPDRSVIGYRPVGRIQRWMGNDAPRNVNVPVEDGVMFSTAQDAEAFIVGRAKLLIDDGVI